MRTCDVPGVIWWCQKPSTVLSPVPIALESPHAHHHFRSFGRGGRSVHRATSLREWQIPSEHRRTPLGRVFLDPGNGPHGHHRNDDPPTARAQRSRSPLNGLVELDWRPARRTHRARRRGPDAKTRRGPVHRALSWAGNSSARSCSIITHCWAFRPSPSPWAAPSAQPSWWLGWCASSICDGYLGFFGPYLVRSISFSFSPRSTFSALPVSNDAGGNHTAARKDETRLLITRPGRRRQTTCRFGRATRFCSA